MRLARWLHPVRASLSPGDFIPAGGEKRPDRRNGRMDPAAKSCREAASWPVPLQVGSICRRAFMQRRPWSACVQSDPAGNRAGRLVGSSLKSPRRADLGFRPRRGAVAAAEGASACAISMDDVAAAYSSSATSRRCPFAQSRSPRLSMSSGEPAIGRDRPRRHRPRPRPRNVDRRRGRRYPGPLGFLSNRAALRAHKKRGGPPPPP